MGAKIGKQKRQTYQQLMAQEGHIYQKVSYRVMRQDPNIVYDFFAANTCPTVRALTQLKRTIIIDKSAYKKLEDTVITLNKLDNKTRQIVYYSWFRPAPKNWWHRLFSRAGYYRKREQGMVAYLQDQHRI